MVDKAIDLLNQANRVEFFAVGHYGVIAQDAQYKFLRLGISSGAYIDPKLQILAAGVLKQGDVIVIVSSSGKIQELLEVAEKARARGAAIIAITSSHSPLSRKADVTLIVDHVEDISTHLPMISRILHLLMIDILAVGVAMRRNSESMQMLNTEDDELFVNPNTLAAGKSDPEKLLLGEAPGVTSSSPMSGMTSHSR